MPHRSIGSQWGKWDLHFHTPSSFDYQKKDVRDDEIVNGLVAAGVVAVAITDHHRIDPGRIRHLQSLGSDRLTVFPGIELRSELGGSEAVHLIGIFSENAEPDLIWTKLQGLPNLAPEDVAKKGDEKFYVPFAEAAKVIRKLGGVVSVHAGRKSNSIENIANDFLYKQAVKEDLAREFIDLLEIGKTTDAKAYTEIVFPKIGFKKPLIICSDNHDITAYAVKAPCWFKSDPAFTGFQQILSDPGERVFIGEVPDEVDRVRRNPTKYMRSVRFAKVEGSTLNEDWFSGPVPLNSGLIAVIGNKGTGKTALVETLGLLGSTALHSRFSFLHEEKFRQPKNNKAKHFLATLEWEDGRTASKVLCDNVGTGSVESVAYVPQHYLEAICNEIQTADSNFDKELKSVIFSHVDEANRLRADSLDELLRFCTEQTRSRLEQLRAELHDVNVEIVELQRKVSPEARQGLLNLLAEKKRELEANEKTKPNKVEKPGGGLASDAGLDEIAARIDAKQAEKLGLLADAKRHDTETKAQANRRAFADRVLARLRNFAASYETFLADATADCIELGLSPRDLVKLEVNTAAVSELRTQAETAENSARASKDSCEKRAADIQMEVEDLTQQLDAPNVEYQNYVQRLQEWEQRRLQIVGDATQAGTLGYVEFQIGGLEGIPARIEIARSKRAGKVRQIYTELESLVSTYKSLYNPVQQFIETHALAAGKFSFEFEASIVCSDIEKGFFALVSQARKGSFCGGEDGRKVLKDLVASSDFDSEVGVLKFTEKLLGHLTHDQREHPAPQMGITEQLRRDVTELQVLDFIFSLSYLTPRYSLRWSGKTIEELSPGERGTLLLIFYLLIDRREHPLIIDQPEENVDNRTVFDILVPCIKEARKKRQVIIVTHNPNLAVVCDADQVIHCTMDKQNRNRITYDSGGLENPAMNKYTIDVLEGTRPAFDRRDSKYQNADA